MWICLLPLQLWENSCIHVKMTLCASVRQRKTKFPISMRLCTWKTRSRSERWTRYSANYEILYPFCSGFRLWTVLRFKSVLHSEKFFFLIKFLQYFSVKLSENMKASSFKKLQKVKKKDNFQMPILDASAGWTNSVYLWFQFYVDPMKLLPLQRFLPRPPGEKGPPRGGRGGGRGGARGGGRGGQ